MVPDPSAATGTKTHGAFGTLHPSGSESYFLWCAGGPRMNKGTLKTGSFRKRLYFPPVLLVVAFLVPAFSSARSPVGAATYIQTDGSSLGSALNLVVQVPHADAYFPQPRILEILGCLGLLTVVVWLTWRVWPRRKAPGPRPSPGFGVLGVNLEGADKSPFWQWFQLQHAREENGVHRFQPNGPKYHSRCHLDVAVSAKNEMQTLTLGVQRAFINGPG